MSMYTRLLLYIIQLSSELCWSEYLPFVDEFCTFMTRGNYFYSTIITDGW